MRRGNWLAVGIAISGLLAPVTAAVANPVLVPVSSTSPIAAPDIVQLCDQNVAAGQHKCYAERRRDIGFTSRRQLQAAMRSTPAGYGPSGLQSAYALPSSTAGAGQRVYLVDAYDDPSAETDLAAYRSQYGLPACTTANGCFAKLNQRGATSPLPGHNTGWAGEISLDLDMVSAACPKCAITLIEADDAGDNLFVAVREAATLGARFVSMSWGGPEVGDEADYDSQYFASTGVIYTASTGDNAYQDGPSYPATSPRVVAVGGTSLSTSSNARGWTESVWDTDSVEGTGSGCSMDEVKPSWQHNIARSVCARRATADVSAVADPATGVAVYQTYGGSGWAVYGGTSASAPIIAAVYALAGTPARSTAPGALPYADPAALNDVTRGANGSCGGSILCSAATGWDGPTGLGTPHGTAAFSDARPHVVSLTNPGAKSGNVGKATSLQLSGTDSAGATLTYSTTGLPAGLSISSTGRISGTPRTAGSYSATVTATDGTRASGSTTFTWTIADACTGNLFSNPGFESGTTGWTMAGTRVLHYLPSAHSGRAYARLDGYGKTHTDRLSRTVIIPAGCAATLRYYLRVRSFDASTSAHDYLRLRVAGTTVQTVTNRSRGGYARRTVDLSGYSGRRVLVEWTGTENSSKLTGFYVDDSTLTLS